MEIQLLNYGLCVIEYATFFAFLSSLLERRFKRFIPIGLIIISGAYLMFLCLNLSILIRSLIGLAVLLIGSSVLFRGTIAVKSSYSLLLLFITSIVDIIFGNLFVLILNEDLITIFCSNFSYRLLSCLSIKLINIIILFIIQREFRNIYIDLHSKYWSLLSSIFFVLLFSSTIFMKFYINIHQSNEITAMFLFISLSFFVMSLIIVYFFSEICAGFQRDKKLVTLETNNKALEEALIVQNKNFEDIRKIRHDMTKHTTNAAALLESGRLDEAIELLKNVGETYNKAQSKYNINTGNNIVDVIISSKAIICESKGISFTYRIEPLDKIKIEAIDLSSLLSNLLDNAIEAADKTNNGYIKIEIFKYKAYYGIYVENSFIGKETIIHSGRRLISTKQSNTIHGYGTKIINEIAQKYNGNSTWSADEKSFKSNVLLKI